MNYVIKSKGIYTILDKEIWRNGRRFIKAACMEGHEFIIRADAFNKQCNRCKHCDGNPLYKTPTYNSWDAMLQRCNNPNSGSFWKYGAAGISVCEEWQIKGGEGFKNFLEDMGVCPIGKTIDRYPDKSGNYEKSNCRWATNSEQGYNQKKRSTSNSGRTGVHWAIDRQKWAASITYGNRTIYLGRFDNFEDAVNARRFAEIKYFGEEKE